MTYLPGVVVAAGLAAMAVLGVIVHRLARQSRLGHSRRLPPGPVAPGVPCPRCRSGYVRRTSGQFGPFLGCTNDRTGRNAAWTLAGRRFIRRRH